jgi:hypothetical protein
MNISLCPEDIHIRVPEKQEENMKSEIYTKEECLRQAVDITKAYAQSGENKHGAMAEFLESVYRKLLEISSSIKREA